MTTVGAGTARIVVSARRSAPLWGVVQWQDSGFWSQLSRFESGLPSSLPFESVRRHANICSCRATRSRTREIVPRCDHDGGAAPLRAAASGRQPPAVAPLARRVGHLDRPLRRHAAAPAASADAARDGARPSTRRISAAAQATAVRRRAQERECEMCGQGEEWHGRQMSLILDHINGVADDNRLENLRIVCPNCAATLDTHCGREPASLEQRACVRCGRCSTRSSRASATARARAASERAQRVRAVERPPYGSHRKVAATSAVAVEVRHGWQRVALRVGPQRVRKWALGSGTREAVVDRRLARRPPRLARLHARPPARRRGRGPARARCSGSRGRSDHAAVAGQCRDAVHRLFGDPGHGDQLVRRRVLDVAAGEATSGGGRILFEVSGPAVDATGLGPGFSGSPIYCPDGPACSA